MLNRKKIDQMELKRGWGVRIVLGLVVIGVLGQLLVSNRLVSAGDELSGLRARTEDLNKENLLLVEKISENESLERIGERAEELGMVPIENIERVKLRLEMAQVAFGF